jgi:hypothetical protein
MKLYLNDEKLTEGSPAALKEVVAHLPSVAKWIESSCKVWNTFYQRVELRTTNGALYGLEL